MELAVIWRGKLICGYMIKIRFEQVVQYLDKNSTDLSLILNVKIEVLRFVLGTHL